MKKIFSIITTLIIFSVATVSAEKTYPMTLKGDLVLVDGGMGVGVYALRSSVKVISNYELSIAIVPVTFDENYYRQHENYLGSPYTEGEEMKISFRYNVDAKTFAYYDEYNNSWVDWDMNKNYSHAEGNPLMPHTAEVAFVSAFNQKFFDEKVIDEDLYNALDLGN